MERVQELIDKLGKQHRQGEGAERLLATLQSLQEVLAGMVRKEAPAAGKVAVVLPPKRRATTVEIGAPAQGASKPLPPVAAVPAPPATDTKAAETVEGQIPYVPAPAVAHKQDAKAAPETPAVVEAQKHYIPQAETKPAEAVPEIPAAFATYMPVPEVQKEKIPYLLQKPPAAEPAAPATPPSQARQLEEREVYHLHFDTADEVPTLTQQHYNPATRELHEVIGEVKESLNDRLKQDKPELAHKLKEAPIKDLRKAIGVNDKFLFVRELFRGDEAMYERSLKTINNFHILAEAEYWISRELKVKLGWDDGRDAVQTFYQLVKRRFS